MKITIEGHENDIISNLADKIGWILNHAGKDEPSFTVRCIDGKSRWIRPNAYNKGEALIVVKRTKGCVTDE